METGRVTGRPLDRVPVMLRTYEKYVTVGLDDEKTYDTEALLALILRDSIEDRWKELTAEQKEHVKELDGVLASKHERVAVALPSAVKNDRSRWWWFLHEGPQVRAV